MSSKENRLEETSIIFQPFIVGILGLSLLVAIWFKMFMLIGIISFILILALFIYTWNKLSLKNISISWDVPTNRIFYGEHFDVNIAIKNDKWLPLVWLEWEFQPSDLVGWGEKNNLHHIVRLLWIPSYQKSEWSFRGKALHRGVYPIGKITVRSGDGFRFSETVKMFHQQQNIYIYPQLIPVLVPPFQLSKQWEVQGKRGGVLEDPLMINRIRDYEPGDDFKKFNWWASARSGKMLTNVYQPIISKQLMIYVDVSGFNAEQFFSEDEEKQREYEEKQKALFEWFLSVIASFVVAYHKQDVRIGYLSNGENVLGKNQLVITPQQEVRNVLDQMAELTDKVATTNEPLDEYVVMNNSRMPLYVFSKQLTDVHVEWIEKYKQMDITFYYIERNDFSDTFMHVAQQMNDLLQNKVVNG